MRSASRTALALIAALGLAAAAWSTYPPEAVEHAEIASSTDAVPLMEIDRDQLTLRANEGRVYHGSIPFTGFALGHHDNGSLAERSAYVDGQREGLSERWHADGTLSYRATYAANRRHGPVETWWENGTRRSESHYVAGVADGTQRQWYRSGALFKEQNLTDGQEDGLQRAWRENGKLYTNYEARGGRIYGLKRANLCYELDEEALVAQGSLP